MNTNEFVHNTAYSVQLPYIPVCPLKVLFKKLFLDKINFILYYLFMMLFSQTLFIDFTKICCFHLNFKFGLKNLEIKLSPLYFNILLAFYYKHIFMLFIYIKRSFKMEFVIIQYFSEKKTFHFIVSVISRSLIKLPNNINCQSLILQYLTSN